jgi:hypothetical protein
MPLDGHLADLFFKASSASAYNREPPAMEVLGKLRDDNCSLLGVGSVLQSRKKMKAQHLLHRSEVNFKNVI